MFGTNPITFQPHLILAKKKTSIDLLLMNVYKSQK